MPFREPVCKGRAFGENCHPHQRPLPATGVEWPERTELTAAHWFTGANSKPMVGVQPFALEKEDGEVRKVFVAWLFVGRVWEAGLDGHRKEALEEFARGKLGGIVRAWGLGSETVLSEQTPNHLSPGGRSKTGCTGPAHKPTRAEAAPCSGVTGTLV